MARPTSYRRGLPTHGATESPLFPDHSQLAPPLVAASPVLTRATRTSDNPYRPDSQLRLGGVVSDQEREDRADETSEEEEMSADSGATGGGEGEGEPQSGDGPDDTDAEGEPQSGDG